MALKLALALALAADRYMRWMCMRRRAKHLLQASTGIEQQVAMRRGRARSDWSQAYFGPKYRRASARRDLTRRVSTCSVAEWTWPGGHLIAVSPCGTRSKGGSSAGPGHPRCALQFDGLRGIRIFTFIFRRSGECSGWGRERKKKKKAIVRVRLQVRTKMLSRLAMVKVG